MKGSKMKINLYLVSLSFFLNMSAYFSLEGLQSSLNSDAGTASLSALYSAYVVTSFFLPSLVMGFLKSRKAIACATLAYAVYTIANYYPRSYTLIPAAIILGSGSSVLWSSKRVYISDLANAYAARTKCDKEEITAKFFGIFWAIFSLSMLVGNAASSAAIQSSGDSYHNESIIYVILINSNTPTPSTSTDLPIDTSKNQNKLSLQCAMHNCETPSTNISRASTDAQSSIYPTILHALFGIFVGIQISAALVLFIFADDPPMQNTDESFLQNNTAPLSANDDEGDENEDGKSSVIHKDEKELLHVDQETDKACQREGKNTQVTHKVTQLSGKNEEANLDQNKNYNAKQKTSTLKRILNQITATVKFMIFNHRVKLLIPITIHVGVLQAFLFGQFTKDWVTCVLGIQYVGYVASIFGLGSAVGGYGTGILNKLVGRKILMAAGLILETILVVYLFLWEPDIVNATWIFFVVSFACGILYALQKTILTTVYTIFFPSDKEAASATFAIWDPLGTSVAYATSGHICNKLFLIIMITLAGVGTIQYLGAEFLYTKSKKQKACNAETKYISS